MIEYLMKIIKQSMPPPNKSNSRLEGSNTHNPAVMSLFIASVHNPKEQMVNANEKKCKRASQKIAIHAWEFFGWNFSSPSLSMEF